MTRYGISRKERNNELRQRSAKSGWYQTFNSDRFCRPILNEYNELLLQHRVDGGWGLPGGLMELAESLEDTARRGVKEETGLDVGKLKLLGVLSGPDYYFKVSNGDELYSVTAVYVSKDVRGKIEVDEAESIEVRYFKLNELPDGLTEEYRSYITLFIDQIK
jgi:ADP-ribose pyrophosphatase YjhB (NUDIX family)